MEEDGIEMDPRESRARARVRGLRVQCLPLQREMSSLLSYGAIVCLCDCVPCEQGEVLGMTAQTAVGGGSACEDGVGCAM